MVDKVQDGRSGAGAPSGHSAEPEPARAVSSAGAASTPNAGDVFTIVYPFVRDTFSEFGRPDEPTWKPGTRDEDIGPEDAAPFADALGSATFTVIGAYRPGRFPARVFFTRKFTDPDGKTFGKGKLHIKTLGQFRRLVSGYLEPFGMDGIPPPRRGWSLNETRREFHRLLAEYASAAGARSGETAKQARSEGRQSGDAERQRDAQGEAP